MNVAYLWAKTDRERGNTWHPLLLHVLDVAASAEAILEREPESTRKRMAQVLGLEWAVAKPWLLLIISCHDLGKASPAFQKKCEEGYQELCLKAGLPFNLPGIDTSKNHAFISQVVLAEILKGRNWKGQLADLVADAVGCHHGERMSPTRRDQLECDRRALGDQNWDEARRVIFGELMKVFDPKQTPTKDTLTGTDFMLLAGLTSFADWIGSNTEFFPFGTVEDCSDLASWWKRGQQKAKDALDAIGWTLRSPLISEPKSFEAAFPNIGNPRPLQREITKALQEVDAPPVLLVEAPMGEGKTEAAFYAHLELQRLFGHRGLYVALPTKATGNAMFERTRAFLASQAPGRAIDLQLLHGAALLNDAFQKIRLSPVYSPDGEGGVRAGEWFTNKKRALLSEYGVGTVDQALLPILPVRHNFVRLWGLANRVVVFDEIHAYDTYTGTLLLQIVQWLNYLGSSVILLSATVPPKFRRELAAKLSTSLPERETSYPRLSVFKDRTVKQVSFEADSTRALEIRLKGVSADLESLKREILEGLPGAGMGLVLVNTVQRAQDLFRLFPEGETLVREGVRVGKRLPDGTEIFLFHARFPANLRQKKEEAVLDAFGKSGDRRGRKILIATQVAEQSLDLDFDMMVSDLAPIDLLLQRAGRLWRHARAARPASEPVLAIAGLGEKEPDSFGNPLWWDMVYREDLLLRTWVLLRTKVEGILRLPDDIDPLVQQVYEECVEIPEFLRERMDGAIAKGEGDAMAAKGQANFAHIGFPDDASWNQPERFVKADDDEPGLHPTLIAQTRLGEPSVVAIPIFPGDGFDQKAEPTFEQAKSWFLRGISLSRKGVVMRLKSLGVPEGWRKSSLLRNCYALILDELLCWTEDASVWLDDDLGLVYEAKRKV